jgi:NAD(P)-dependent dehydrogenase (short-subunit alcohol dehydrogenase family)
MTRNIFGAMGMETPRHDIIKEHKLGRFGQPEEIAAACFLLSSDAPFITGHSLVVDGGYTPVGTTASPRCWVCRGHSGPPAEWHGG